VVATSANPILPIPFQHPTLPPAEQIERYFKASRAARYFSNGGPCVQLLQQRLAERVGVPCVAVANATLGLVAALVALKREGREIVMPSFTFPAAVQAASWVGLVPRFVDVDPQHWHVDPGALRTALRSAGNEAAVVLLCSAFGTPPDGAVRRAWMEVCAHQGVPCIVDSAAGFGAVSDDGVPIGAQGDAEIVSFHATKPFAVGEGGTVFSRHPDVLARVARVINFGLDERRRVVEPLAFNGKLSELHGATALAVLDGFDDVLSSRRAAARQYEALLGELGSFQAGGAPGTWQFVPLVLSDAGHRDRCLSVPREEVEFRAYYAPLHRIAAYAGAPGAGSLHATEHLATHMLSLPMANDLQAEEISIVCAAVRRQAALVS
jgi:dTDP-4-amino-4,6-dideoxygalactose transaminase